jgi:hypothetical protein
MVMLYEGGLKKLTATRYPVYPVMFYSVSPMGYVVGYVVTIIVNVLVIFLGSAGSTINWWISVDASEVQKV